MKYLIVLVSSLAVAIAQKQQPLVDDKYKNIPIISQQNIVEHDGSFTYSFEGGDGTRAQQNGQLKYVDQQNAGEAVQGGYSYQVSFFILWFLNVKTHTRTFLLPGWWWQNLPSVICRRWERLPPSRRSSPYPSTWWVKHYILKRTFTKLCQTFIQSQKKLPVLWNTSRACHHSSILKLEISINRFNLWNL